MSSLSSNRPLLFKGGRHMSPEIGTFIFVFISTKNIKNLAFVGNF